MIVNESWVHEGQIREHGREGIRRPCNVLFAGRLVALKRTNLLLDAIAQLRGQGESVRCTVVGDGPERSSLERQAVSLGIAQQVIFAGWLQVLGKEMLAAYDAADVFCLPSFSEGLPLVLIEAMARGVPVVATAVSGTPELVNHEQSGLLIPRDDLPALVASIRRLMTDAELWRRCVTNGYAVARRHAYELQRGRLADAIGRLAS
jgi:glycosyltransferase involved in cell wall biosynthesis